MKKYISGLLFLSVGLVAFQAAAQIDNLSSTSVLVCRSHQCAYASYSMTKGFLYNKIAQMMEKNVGKTVLVCEADPHSHICLQEGLSIPASTVYAPLNVKIQRLKLTDEKKLNGATGLDLVWDYRIQAGNTYPSCELGLSRLSVDYTDKVEMTTQDFICNITETGRTSVNATYNIDYLDFDYGFIGAYYTIGVGEAVQGDKTGYALFRFTAKTPIPEEVEEIPLPPPPAPQAEPVPEILMETAPQPQPQPQPQIQPQPQPQPVPEVTVRVVPQVEVQETLIRTEPSVQTIEVPLPPPPQPPVILETKPIRVVPEIVIRQEPAPAPVPAPAPQPSVIKTVTVEKMVITSDGTRQITPPETRTIIDGKIQ